MGDCYASSILKNGEKNFQFEVGELVTRIELLLHFLYVLILKQNSKKKNQMLLPIKTHSYFTQPYTQSNFFDLNACIYPDESCLC